jgi:hypothetical protein
MKRSAYARQLGLTYKTAHQWRQAGQLDVYQRPTGTSIACAPKTAATGMALYACVSSADELKADVTRQLQPLRNYATARLCECAGLAGGGGTDCDLRARLVSPTSDLNSRRCSLTGGWSSIGTGSLALATALSRRSWSTNGGVWKPSIRPIPAMSW